MTIYVAPAHKVLTELHRQDPDAPPFTSGPDRWTHTTGTTICGRPMLADDLWLPIEKRDGDRECMECADPGSTAEQRVCEQELF